VIEYKSTVPMGTVPAGCQRTRKYDMT